MGFNYPCIPFLFSLVRNKLVPYLLLQGEKTRSKFRKAVYNPKLLKQTSWGRGAEYRLQGLLDRSTCLGEDSSAEVPSLLLKPPLQATQTFIPKAHPCFMFDSGVGGERKKSINFISERAHKAHFSRLGNGKNKCTTLLKKGPSQLNRPITSTTGRLERRPHCHISFSS